MTIAIIGAGMAGLAAAKRLGDAGKNLRVFDKGRGPGGRMSTRRMETALGELRWDHGAQYFSARGAGFLNAVSRWVDAGACAAWGGRLVHLDGDQISPLGAEPRYVGTPGMNAIIRHMASDQPVEWGRRAARIEGRAGALQVVFEDNTAEGPFEQIIVAVPAEQAVDLLESPAPDLARGAGGVSSAPCWTGMLAFEAPVACEYDGARVSGSGLGWLARNSAKPGRAADQQDPAETWVVQASAAWSRANLERDKEAIAADLSAAFTDLTGAPEPVFIAAHRWRYSQVETPLGQAFQWDAAAGLVTCGDWHLGAKIEDAWTSGHAAARALLA